MTSPTSANIDRHGGGTGGRGGFTLVELIVVVGIIVVLAALLLPMIGRAYRSAQRTATFNDLQTISTALDAYKNDFGDYPRVRYDPAIGPRSDYGSPGMVADRPNPQTGAEVLYFALMGPADATDPMPQPMYRSKQDGLDGLGFRVRPGGKSYPPYLPADRFKGAARDNVFGPDTDRAKVLNFCFMDRANMPILYFPRSSAKPNVTRVPAAGGTPPYVASTYLNPMHNSEVSRYDADDNLVWFCDAPFTAMQSTSTFSAQFQKAFKRVQAMLGDRHNNPAMLGSPPFTPDGVIQPYENAVDLPYLLWAAGGDERFAPSGDDTGLSPWSPGATLDAQDIELLTRCDDVTNFER